MPRRNLVSTWTPHLRFTSVPSPNEYHQSHRDDGEISPSNQCQLLTVVSRVKKSSAYSPGSPAIMPGPQRIYLQTKIRHFKMTSAKLIEKPHRNERIYSDTMHGHVAKQEYIRMLRHSLLRIIRCVVMQQLLVNYGVAMFD